jgi:hypothetical protein
VLGVVLGGRRCLTFEGDTVCQAVYGMNINRREGSEK